MSWLLSDVPKKTTIPLEETFTRGPTASLHDILTSAFDEQYRANSVLGVQGEFLDRINKAVPLQDGKELPLFTADEARSIAEFFEDGKPLPTDEAANPFASPAARRAPNIERLQGPPRARGSLKERFDTFQELTGGGMSAAWDDTKKGIKEVLDRAADVRARALPVDNFLFSFLGGGAASFTLRDPVNVATVFAGGVGKSVLTRLGSEVGINSGIEAINVLTGVADNRRLAGVPMSNDEIVSDIALTGFGAGALRGVFEGAGAALRRATRAAPANPPPPVPTIRTPEGTPAPSRGLVGAFGTPEGFTGEFSPVLRAAVTPDERVPLGSLETTAQRLRVNYLLDYMDDARVPPLARGAVTDDFGFTMKAVDRAIATDAFKYEGLSARLGGEGDGASPFRFLASNVQREDAEKALRETHPALFAQRAQLEARIANLEATIRQSAEHVDVKDTTAGKQLIANERRIAEWKASLERGEYPKKRQRELVQKDIADLEAKNVELRTKALGRLPGGGKNVASRIAKLTEAVGQVDHEIAHQRSVIEADNAEAAARTPKIEVVTRFEKLVEDHERSLGLDDGKKYDAVAAQVAERSGEDVDLGDIKLTDKDLDLEIFDEETMSNRPLRDIMRDLTKDNDTERAMKECAI